MGPHLFIVPARAGSPTGGNLYNDGLLAHLGEMLGERVMRAEPRQVESILATASPHGVWIDSLYFDRLTDLRRMLPMQARVMLLAHYLPSWVEHGDGLSAAQLSRVEREALAAVDGALATSHTMSALLTRLCPKLDVHVAEPAHETAPRLSRRAHTMTVLFVGSLVAAKGLQGLLASLVPRTRIDDSFELLVMGREDLEPEYAGACRALVAATPALATRVRFLGPIPHALVLSQLQNAHVLVSASRMESYGMALAEARTAGVVVLARRGGHAAAQVPAESGGSVTDDDDALADSLLHLARKPGELGRRLALAERSAPAPRSWQEVARDVAAIAHRLPRAAP